VAPATAVTEKVSLAPVAGVVVVLEIAPG